MRDDAVALLACLLSGFLLTLALPPNGWWPLAFAIVPLFVAVARATRGRTALLAGGAFGLSFFAVYVLWLPRSFAVLFGPAFWVVFPLMVALLALFWGLTCWASWRLAGGRAGRAPGAAVLLVLPVAWVLVEWARTQGNSSTGNTRSRRFSPITATMFPSTGTQNFARALPETFMT